MHATEFSTFLNEQLSGDDQESEPSSEPSSEASSKPRESSHHRPVPAEPDHQTGSGRADHPSLGIEVSRAHWGGSILAQDLKLEGRAWARSLSHISLEVTDSGGRRLERIDPVTDTTDSGLEPDSRSRMIAWRARIDGKRFLLARFPVELVVRVHDRDGTRAVARRTIDR